MSRKKFVDFFIFFLFHPSFTAPQLEQFGKTDLFSLTESKSADIYSAEIHYLAHFSQWERFPRGDLIFFCVAAGIFTALYSIYYATHNLLFPFFRIISYQNYLFADFCLAVVCLQNTLSVNF